MARRRNKRNIWPAMGIALVLVVAVNVALFVVYRERTYPRTQLMGTTLGSVPYSVLNEHLKKRMQLPEQLTLRQGNKQATVTPAELGITLDATPTIESAKAQRPLVPLVALAWPPTLEAPISIDTQKLTAQATALAPKLNSAPQNARLSLEQGNVTLHTDTPGTTIDIPALQQVLQTGLARGKTTIATPTRSVAADVTTADLQAKKAGLEKQLNTRISLQYGDKTITPSKADMGKWYEQTSAGLALSTDAIARAVLTTAKSLNIQPKDNYQVATEIAKAMQNGTPYTETLVAATPGKTITYCTAVRNVPGSELPGLKEKAAATLADSRGWSLNGSVAFKEVSSGCEFTLWLSAADQMPTFGAICDSMWSCRVGPNVVINYDRWRNASPAWNEYGGSLEQYRDMVINHETGHWLSFGHDHCSGPGQQAPVMQQQSINLQGCTFNPWPTSAELTRLRQNLKL